MLYHYGSSVVNEVGLESVKEVSTIDVFLFHEESDWLIDLPSELRGWL